MFCIVDMLFMFVFFVIINYCCCFWNEYFCFPCCVWLFLICLFYYFYCSIVFILIFFIFVMLVIRSYIIFVHQSFVFIRNLCFFFLRFLRIIIYLLFFFWLCFSCSSFRLMCICLSYYWVLYCRYVCCVIVLWLYIIVIVFETIIFVHLNMFYCYWYVCFITFIVRLSLN